MASTSSAAIKVCGLTRIEDALLAWELGAAALGFVFHTGSLRNVTVFQAAHIRRQLPVEVACIGVFVDRSSNEVQDIAHQVGLSAIQLHGHETPELAAELKLPVIKAIRAEETDEGLLRAFDVAAFLFDASHPTLAGGTGLMADWNLARDLATRHPLILAGGLRPGNVREALDFVNPLGLDLSSSLEAAPGQKDPERLQELFRCIPMTGERPCLF